MPNLYALAETAHEIEQRIRANRLLHLPVDWEAEFVYPHYDGLSIYNLTQTILKIFGAEAAVSLDAAVWDGDLPYGHVDRVVLFITDGLGYQLLSQLLKEDMQLNDCVSDITAVRGIVPLTSIAPSTTGVALPLLWTAQPPLANGMLGTSMWLREFATLGDMLSYAPLAVNSHKEAFLQWGIDPKDFIPLPSLPQRLESVQVPVHLLLTHSLVGTGLSRLMHRGIHKTHLHTGGSDVWQRLVDVLTETVGQRCMISAYLPNIDSLSHMYGYDTRYVRAEITQQMIALRKVLESARVKDGRTLVLMTADHGHYDANTKISLAQDPLLEGVRAGIRCTYGGDERFAYLYVRDRMRTPVLETLTEHYRDQLAFIEAEEAVNAGLFGTGQRHVDVFNRLGNIIIMPRKGVRLTDQYRGHRFVSLHAGLTDWEMLVPLLWRRI